MHSYKVIEKQQLAYARAPTYIPKHSFRGSRVLDMSEANLRYFLMNILYGLLLYPESHPPDLRKLKTQLFGTYYLATEIYGLSINSCAIGLLGRSIPGDLLRQLLLMVLEDWTILSTCHVAMIPMCTATSSVIAKSVLAYTSNHITPNHLLKSRLV